MAKKKAETAPEVVEAAAGETGEAGAAVEGAGAEAVVEVSEDERLRTDPTDEEKLTTIGLDAGDGTYTYVTVDKDDARLRRLMISGRNYEHVHDDAFGRWLFCSM